MVQQIKKLQQINTTLFFILLEIQFVNCLLLAFFFTHKAIDFGAFIVSFVLTFIIPTIFIRMIAGGKKEVKNES